MEIIIRVSTGLLIVFLGALIDHLYPNGTLFILVTVHLYLGVKMSYQFFSYKNIFAQKSACKNRGHGE